MASEQDLIASDIEGYLAAYQSKELLRFVAVGSVDDGKSTLIGRLLVDTGMVYQDHLEQARRATTQEGMDIDLSLLTDGLTAEREQGITIDVAYRYFTTDKRKFIIADTPGHVQYTRNMVTGASTANVAIILIDARLGVLQQSRRHAFIASLLGIPHLAVCVNKMDLVAFDQARFAAIAAEFEAFTSELRFHDVTFFPISALRGDNCVKRSAATPWYEGPTVLDYLETVPITADRNLSDFRFPVQTVLRPNLDYRGFAGQVVSGVVKKGDAVMALPSGKTSTVKAIDVFEGELEEAFSPQSVVIRLADEIDVSRGDVLVRRDDLPSVGRTFGAHLVWLGEAPLDPARSYLLKHGTQVTRVDLDAIHARVDMDTLAETPTNGLSLNDIGLVTLTTHRALAFDAYAKNRATGSFILVDSITNATVGAGMIREGTVGSTLGDTGSLGGRATRSQVSPRERAARLGQRGGALGVVGGNHEVRLAVAYALERRLFDEGRSAFVIEGDVVGAKLLASAGLVAITAIDEVDADIPCIVLVGNDVEATCARAYARLSELGALEA